MDLSKLGSAIQNYGQATEAWLGSLVNDISDAAFRGWALTEARTAATVFIPVYERATGLSPLTSKMLTMYLNGRLPTRISSTKSPPRSDSRRRSAGWPAWCSRRCWPK